MNRRAFAFLAGCGYLLVILLIAAGVTVFVILPGGIPSAAEVGQRQTRTPIPGAQATQEVIATFTPGPTLMAEGSSPGPESLVQRYQELNPGVVNIQVFVQRAGTSGQGAGSGFILDDQGHIVTNDHVVAQATRVTVVFYDGTEVRAEIVGTDADSDLAVIRAERLPEGAHPLPLGDSDQVQVGEWVIAIGNPFGLGNSMTLGIVSAVGRVIAAAETTFSIPQAIQTDAAINPGNSGGPLLDLQGQVVGVNAQIASSSGTNSGVGFAIPVNIVRRVTPSLIETGSYQWPWLGIRGASLNLVLAEANNLDTQKGAYIHEVVQGGPADKAGLQGTSGRRSVGDISDVPVGGDVIIAVNGQPVADLSDLLVRIASKNPGDTMELTILRDGKQQTVQVVLEARP
jgi:2-alkenal reductase